MVDQMQNEPCFSDFSFTRLESLKHNKVLWIKFDRSLLFPRLHVPHWYKGDDKFMPYRCAVSMNSLMAAMHLKHFSWGLSCIPADCIFATNLQKTSWRGSSIETGNSGTWPKPYGGG